MKLVILTSSRADYGIYLPLIKKIKSDDFFDLKIIAFGTHLSRFYGYTVDQIEKDGFKVDYRIESLIHGDSPEAIASAMSLTSLKFAALWSELQKSIDLIICLGDRYEMFAAIMSSIPFNIPIAHIHAGETTLGAIDNTMRHSISLASTFFFVATEKFADKVETLTGERDNVFNVGALSLDNMDDLDLLSKSDFFEQFQIDLNIPTILITFHPETVAVEKNKEYIKELVAALHEIDYQVLITLPNADTKGNFIREKLLELAQHHPQVIAVESLGTKGYFSAMEHCSFLLGNTSSGIIEAASFKKFVVNLGNRQKGRAQSNNIINVPIEKAAILNAVNAIPFQRSDEIQNIYWRGKVAKKIVDILKNQVWKELKGSS